MRKSISKVSVQLGAWIFFILVAMGAQAQTTVTGKVVDAKAGNGLSGVTVTVKGTNVATQTDADGSFSIKSPSGGTLIFSSAGYVTQEVGLAGRTYIDVSLVVNAEKLGEVVIIGYGSVRKKDLTGSVAQVTAKDFQTGNISSPEGLIAGKVAGVSVISGGGAPGAGTTIRIRGGASLNASNDPLIVIDGIPLDNGGIAGASNSLSLINPDDIESFSVLKDASATAIYGSRASNGVIMITTKKGRNGAKPVVTLNSSFSLSKIIKYVDVLDASQFRQFVNTHGTPTLQALMGNANTDWQKQIYQTAFGTDNNVSISGGYKNMPYRLSLGYLNQQGILKTDKLNRYSLGVNISPRFFDDHLKVDVNIRNAIEETRFGNQGAIGAAIAFDPTQPVYSGKGDYNGYWEWLDPSSGNGLKQLAPRNPLGLLMDRHDLGEVRRSVGNALIDYKLHFLPDLHAFVNIGYDIATSGGTITVDPNAAQDYLRFKDANEALHGGRYNQYREKRNNRTLETYLNYTKNFSDDSKIEAVAGYGYYDFLTTKYNFPDLTSDGVAVSTPDFALDKPRYTLLSYWGRIDLSFRGRYLLTGSIRTDGSSRFAPNERWSVFPAGAFAWNIKNEEFLKSSRAISDLKLRIGYGTTGQQSGIGYYDYTSFYRYSIQSAQYQLGDNFYHLYAPTGYYPQRTWEETDTYNAGLDFGFMNNRISGAVDVYYKKTKNLLNNIDQPAGSNFSNIITANVGDMENRGVEVSLNLQPVRKEKVKWDLNLNGSYNENKITNLFAVANSQSPGNKYGGIAGGTGNSILINSVGLPRGSFYVYKQVYDANGKLVDNLFADLNRDGVINENDLYQYKSIDPDFLFGASTNLSIGKMAIGCVLRASVGNYVFNNTFSGTGIVRNIVNPIGILDNGSADVLVSGVSGSGDKYLLSDYYVENASFLKMDNAYLNYNVGNVFHNAATLIISANVQNVFIVTKYKGLDPEIASGIDNNFYPRPRIYTLGFNFRFK